MADTKKIALSNQEVLNGLLDKGKKNGGSINYDDILDAFQTKDI